MSHFPVLVITKKKQDVESLLERYSENREVEPYVRYTKDEAIAYVREDISYNLKCLKEKLDDPDAKDKEYAKKWYDIYVKRNDWTDEQCYEWLGEDYDVDEYGNLLSVYNPESKWDWWVIGGRFAYSTLREKDSGEYMDTMWAVDLDITPDPDEYKACCEWWDGYVEGKEPDDGWLWTPEYYKKFYVDRETYARINSSPIFRAVVTPDGEWHEKGRMGWFAMTSETPEESLEWDNNFIERFLKPAIEQNDYLTVVDCHI